MMGRGTKHRRVNISTMFFMLIVLKGGWSGWKIETKVKIIWIFVCKTTFEGSTIL